MISLAFSLELLPGLLLREFLPIISGKFTTKRSWRRSLRKSRWFPWGMLWEFFGKTCWIIPEGNQKIPKESCRVISKFYGRIAGWIPRDHLLEKRIFVEISGLISESIFGKKNLNKLFKALWIKICLLESSKNIVFWNLWRNTSMHSWRNLWIIYWMKLSINTWISFSRNL